MYENEDIPIDFDTIESDEELEDDPIDTSWIKEFELVDKDYSSFYKEDVQFIQIQYLYVNKENEVTMTKQDKLLLQSTNIISQEELLSVIKKNSIVNNKKYYLVSILKYNIDLEPIEIKDFLLNSSDHSFLTSVKHLHSIPLNKTINMFHDLNNITILFHEVEPSKYVMTKRVHIYKRNKTHRKRLKG
jgi:hypothetical protein